MFFLAQHHRSMTSPEKLFPLCLRNPQNAIGMGDPTVKAAPIPSSAKQCYFATLSLSTALKDSDKVYLSEHK